MPIEVRPIKVSEVRQRIKELEALNPPEESDQWLDLLMYRSALEIAERSSEPKYLGASAPSSQKRSSAK